MPNDAAKNLIFARRARFVAAALATMSAACGKDAAKVDAGPRAGDAGVDAEAARPHACLCVCQPGDPLCSCL